MAKKDEYEDIFVGEPVDVWEDEPYEVFDEPVEEVPEEEVPEEAPKGVVYRRLPNGGLVAE